MKKLALIGYGDAGSRYASAIAGKAAVTAICDIDFAKATNAAQIFKCSAYASADELLQSEKNLDAVVIATPNGLHAEHCIKALQAGVNVICEGPVCLTTSAIWQIIETAKFCRRNVCVIEGNLSNKIMLLKNEIATGGKINGFQLQCGYQQLSDSWKNTLFPGGGIFYTQLFSSFNALIKMMGPIEGVKGFAKSNDEHFEFEGEVKLIMTSGVTGSVRWSDKYTNAVLQIATENKTFSFELIPAANNVLIANNSEMIEGNKYESILGTPLTSLSENLLTIGSIEKIYKTIRPVLSSNH